jgi:hypothetical protein
MASIPLPELDIKPIQMPDIAEQYGRIMQIRQQLQNMQYQQQMQPLQLQQQQNALAMQQREMRDQQVGTQALIDSKGDMQKYMDLLGSGGVSPETYFKAQQGQLAYQTQLAQKNKIQLENEKQISDRVAEQLSQAKQAAAINPQTGQPTDPQTAATMWDSALTMAEKGGLIPQGQVNHQLPTDPRAFDIAASLTGFHSQAIENQLKTAQTGKAVAETPGAQAESALKQAQQQAFTQWSQQPNNQGKNYDQYLAEQQATRAGAEAKARLPYEMQLASFNRQTAMGNVLAEHAINQVTDIFTNPQHGYSQTLSQLSATKNAIQSAQNGDQLAASMAPLMTALGVVSYAGIHRINQYDINAAGPEVGSVLRQIDAKLSKMGSGKLASGTATEMSGLMDNLLDAKYNTVLQSARVAAANGGIDPSRITIMGKQGNLVRLADAAKQAQGGAGGGGEPTAIGPNGHTMVFRNGQWMDPATGQAVR